MKLTLEQIELYRTAFMGSFGEIHVALCDLALSALDAEQGDWKAAFADLLDDAERRSAGFPSKWAKAEEWFAFRDHAKAILEAKPPSPEAWKALEESNTLARDLSKAIEDHLGECAPVKTEVVPLPLQDLHLSWTEAPWLKEVHPLVAKAKAFGGGAGEVEG